MATALVLIAVGIAVLLRGRKLANAAIDLQEGAASSAAEDYSGDGGPFEPPRAPGAPSRGRLPVIGLPSIPFPDVIDPSRKG